MNRKLAAQCLSELGNLTRLDVYRLLVRAGLDGMNISDIQTRLGVPASTLAFHLGGLVGSRSGLAGESRPRGHLPRQAPPAYRRDGVPPRAMLRGIRRRTGGAAAGKLICPQ
jgi:hypothetical protein